MDHYLKKPEVVCAVKIKADCSNVPGELNGIVEGGKWAVMYKNSLKPVCLNDGEFYAMYCKLIDYKKESDQEFKDIPVRINYKVEVDGKSYYLITEMFIEKYERKIRGLEKDKADMEDELMESRAADRIYSDFLGEDACFDSPTEKALYITTKMRNLEESGIAIGLGYHGNPERDDQEIINAHYKRKNQRVVMNPIEEAKKNYTKEKDNGRKRNFARFQGSESLQVAEL